MLKAKNRNTLVLAVLVCAVFLPVVSLAEIQKGPAPNFTLKSLRGQNLKLSEHRGEVIMINFWATWCGTCKQEMEKINEMYLRYRDEGFTVLAINVDNNRQKVNTWLRGMRLAFPILFDNDKAVSEQYEVEELPSTYIVDKDGNFRYVHNEYKPGLEDVYQKQVRELMEEY